MYFVVFIAGAMMTAYVGQHFGFWEGFACACTTIVGTVIVYRFIDRDSDD